MLNLTAGGEYCWNPSRLVTTFHEHTDSIRNLLAIHDRSEIVNSDTDTRLLSLLFRATDCVYPNLYCELKPSEETNNAVYIIAKSVSMTVHATSVVRPYRPDDNKIIDTTAVSPSADGMWTLQEIINTVYEKTGIPKGIFIFTGCTGEDNSMTITKSTLAEFNRLRQIIRIEDLSYSS
ncbi:MAG: hypothetical protein EBX50_18415, partial [Chitinophagia bacterium]|nr:hypothetical protein [Chitinophagia bacterium]